MSQEWKKGTCRPFIILLYNKKITFFFARSRQDRLKSSTKDFVAKYNLDNPVAGNFYQAQYDEYVDVLRAETIE